MKPVTGIVLAAGSGSRMGELKQLLNYQDKPILQWVIDAAANSMLGSVGVVLGYEEKKIIQTIDFSKVDVIKNPLFEQGQSTSLKAGIRSISRQYDAALFLLGDQPLIDYKVINRIIETYQNSQASILIPTFKGRKGNPVLIARSVFPNLLELSGDKGGRTLFHEFSGNLQLVEVNTRSILFDLDTKNDYQKLIDNEY